MKPRKNSRMIYVLMAMLASAFLLAACGQLGPLYLPKPHPTKPPPPPRDSRLKKETPRDIRENAASETEKTDKGN